MCYTENPSDYAQNCISSCSLSRQRQVERGTHPPQPLAFETVRGGLKHGQAVLAWKLLRSQALRTSTWESSAQRMPPRRLRRGLCQRMRRRTALGFPLRCNSWTRHRAGRSKTWLFRNQAEITIGTRQTGTSSSESRSVCLPSPRELDFLDRKLAGLLRWGETASVVAADLITEYAITGEVSFRLGMEGPTMRFCTHAEKVEGGATISCDTLPEPLIQLDERKLQSTVGEIANGDYFQTLQQRAKLIRHHRGSD